MAESQDKIIILDDKHPLVKHIKTFDWSGVLQFGLVTIQVREGKPRLLTLQVTHKLD